jgi:RNA polymerase sigma-70 factor (ECF subfamily)
MPDPMIPEPQMPTRLIMCVKLPAAIAARRTERGGLVRWLFGAQTRVVDDLTSLALRARDGDRGALDGFVERVQPDVWRLCRRLVGPSGADDACQDSLIRAMGSLRTYRGESSARTWALAVTRRTCIDVIRRRERQRRLMDRLTARPIEVGTAGDQTIELDSLVQALDPDRRLAFVLTQEFGLSYEEAATVCHCPLGTIRSRVARARAELVDQLREPVLDVV